MSPKVLLLNHNQMHFGTWHRCIAIATQLKRQGIEVTVVCAAANEFDLRLRRKDVDGIECIILPRIQYGKYFSGQLLRLVLTLWIVAFEKYDICYAFTVAQPQIAWPMLFAKKIRNRPIVVDWDDLWGGGFGRYHHPLIHKILFWHERAFLKFADLITFVSEDIKAQIKTTLDAFDVKNETKLIKIPNGIAKKSVKNNVALVRQKLLPGLDGVSLFISVGNTYTSSLDLMLNAFQIVVETNKECHLLFIGKEQHSIQSGIQSRNISSYCSIVGSVEHSELQTWLSFADVLVLPMDNLPEETARFPMRFADYLLAKKPIVSNAVGEVAHLIKTYNCGYLAGETAQSFASEMLSALQSPKKSKRLSKNAYALSQNELNWENICKPLAKAIPKLI